jgi:hypothetical protein
MSTTARVDKCPSYTCIKCGSTVNLDDYNKKSPKVQAMKQNVMCFSCTYWSDQLSSNNSLHHIINGQLWVFNPWIYYDEHPVFPEYVGHKGEAFYIMLNNKDVIRSNNVSLLGDIPHYFRQSNPDTARFITSKAYKIIKNHPFFKCQSKGCWDRYHCYWYDERNEVNGPWNIIPKSHVIGEECCEIFLEKTNVYV